MVALLPGTEQQDEQPSLHAQLMAHQIKCKRTAMSATFTSVNDSHRLCRILLEDYNLHSVC